MEGIPCCMCSISFENQSLEGNGSSGISVQEINDNMLTNELNISQNNNSKETINIKSWVRSCDPLPVQNAVENLCKFFAKTFAQNDFYLLFSELEGKSDGDRNLSEADISRVTTVKKECSSTSSVEDASIFGSPLKLEPIGDISMNETTSDCLSSTSLSDQRIPQLTGLPIQEARKVLSKFCQIKNVEQKDSLLKTIVILCCHGGADSGRDRPILLGAHHDVGGETNKLATFKVMYCHKKHSLSFMEPLNLQNGSVCSMECSYNLLEQQEANKRLRIEAHWSNCRGNSIISNLHTARFRLHLAAPFGCRESPLHRHLGQLKYVMTLCKGLEEGELPRVLSTKSHNAQEKLEDLFTRVKNGMPANKMPPVSDSGRGKKIDLTSSYSRDITDELWDIFAQSENYQDMVGCLKMTLNILKKNELPLFVRSDNETMLAKLIRQFSSGMNYFPPLTNLMSLRIVAELGLERMKKVYSSILMQNDLCSSADIDNFLKDSLKEEARDILSVSVNETEHQIKETIVETVKKLHHCVDLICLVDLQAENLNLKTIGSHVLNYYRLNCLDENHMFVISLDTRQASQEVETMSPCLVRREYKAGDEGRVECYLSDSPDGLTLSSQPDHHSEISNGTNSNISVNLGGDASKDYYKFKTEENIMILCPPKDK